MSTSPKIENYSFEENSAAHPSEYLIKGDISGIQNFIFNVNSKGAARSLKGRSFFIKILLEVVMRKIFDIFQINKENQDTTKISTSGGNFILKLNLEAIEKIDDIQLEISKALQYINLNMMLSCIKIQDSYEATLKLLDQKTRERKFCLLVKYDHFFEPFARKEISDINGFPNERNRKNTKWHKITDELSVKDNSLLIKKDESASSQLKISGNRIEILGYLVSFGKGGIPISGFLESIFPLKEDDTYNRNDNRLKFEDLSAGKYFNPNFSINRDKWISLGQKKKGINKLGALAMDVDDLGKALGSISSSQGHKLFDEELQTFFNGELMKIIEQDFRNMVYTVTAGGDDSFFVGKWNTMIDLAITIRNAFLKKFEQRGLSISAGIIIVDPKFPVVRFAQLADEYLKNAKYNYDKKGNISLFGEVLDWDIFIQKIIPLREEFNKSKNHHLTSGLLAKARQTAVDIASDTGMRLSDMWKMSYYLRDFEYNKNRKKVKGDKTLDQHRKLLADSIDESNELIKRSLRMAFPIAARLAELDHR